MADTGSDATAGGDAMRDRFKAGAEAEIERRLPMVSLPEVAIEAGRGAWVLRD